MTGGSKIIGMWRDRGEDALEENVEFEENGAEDALENQEQVSDYEQETGSGDDNPADQNWDEYYEDEAELNARNPYLAPGLLSAFLVVWTGFFIWANRDIFTTLPSVKGGIDLFSQWCVPAATLILVYLLYMRNSTQEAHRFSNVSLSLRAESEQLETRLKTVNNELSIAREFLASETRELETLGSQSSEKLNKAASNIKSALTDGLTKMTKLDEVGSSAYKNLEQLREHLPVVINTAKDVTNQIGNAGRTSQTEIAAMVATLKRVGEVGTAAKKSLQELSGQSEESLTKLSTTAEDIKNGFVKQLEETETGSNRISTLLKNTSGEVVTLLNQTRSELAKETTRSSDALKADLDELETAMTAANERACIEEERLRTLIANLNQTIAEANENVASLDNESGEKTAKLAFAMTALEQNSQALQSSIENGHGVADGMIERMEALLIALDTGARELDETLPAAFGRMNESSETGLELLGRISEEAAIAGAAADLVAAKVKQSDAAISTQRSKLEQLTKDGDLASETVLEKLNALTASLKEVREQNEELAESSGEKLISALMQVKETAKQASEHSRKALEDSITGSAEVFEKISEEALNRIIEEKIATIAPKLESAVAKAVATTETTANHLTNQLGAIEKMTNNLEQRISFAKEDAEHSGDESFSRRVALLTESLNSTAIDVTKLLSNEVTDTEWTAYLKGDRGIFTRRAVRLLDAGEVREILTEYEGNSEFREHVNRYIHDFETMLRGVLSTREGSAISVTLLSSDIGKLYVALAQAIERLRA